MGWIAVYSHHQGSNRRHKSRRSTLDFICNSDQHVVGEKWPGTGRSDIGTITKSKWAAE